VSIIKALFRAGPPADHDFWYQPVGYGATSAAGVRVDPDTALKLSAVWACVRIISESIATLPLMVYERGRGGSKQVADQHPIYDLLHDQPNRTQTALEWRQQMTAHALLRGNAYSRLIPGPRGFADQIVPLHPDLVTPPDVPTDPYRYRAPGGRDEQIPSGEMFHLRGLTLAGSRGVSVVEYARESMGIGMAAEQYAGRVFSQDGRPRGTLEHPGKLSKEAQAFLKESWQEAYSGLGNAHKVAVLQEGMKFSAISVSPDDAQMLASREFSVEDICRWFGVPPHMVGSTAKVTSWGSGIEQLSIGYVTYTLLPWLRRWEQTIRRDLIIDKRRFFAEHTVSGLLRGDQKTRFEAYAIGRQNGWLSANDIRRLENMNPIPDGDVYLQPLNMAPAGQAGADRDDAPIYAEYRDLAAHTNGRANGHAE